MFTLDWVLSENRGNSMIGYHNKSHLQERQIYNKDKAVIGKEVVVTYGT